MKLLIIYLGYIATETSNVGEIFFWSVLVLFMVIVIAAIAVLLYQPKKKPFCSLCGAKAYVSETTGEYECPKGHKGEIGGK